MALCDTPPHLGTIVMTMNNKNNKNKWVKKKRFSHAYNYHNHTLDSMGSITVCLRIYFVRSQVIWYRWPEQTDVYSQLKPLTVSRPLTQTHAHCVCRASTPYAIWKQLPCLRSLEHVVECVRRVCINKHELIDIDSVSNKKINVFNIQGYETWLCHSFASHS